MRRHHQRALQSNSLHHETLERREMLAADMGPPAPANIELLDLNQDGILSPADPLLAINALTDPHASRDDHRLDLNRDGSFGPADALMLIIEMNRHGDESDGGHHGDHGRHGHGGESGHPHQAPPRSIDGSDNNRCQPDWGSAETPLLQETTSEYADGLSAPAGSDRASAREISNLVADQDDSILNDRGLSDLLWQWGQFLDHDLDLTETTEELLPIEVPAGDPYFDPLGTGSATIDFHRSVYEVDEAGVRRQINLISAFIDGSNVCGSDQQRADALRTFEGGRLKTSAGDLLPFNDQGLDNAGGTSDTLFLAGDVRANEQVGLTAMHTLWVREHNRIADELAAGDPRATDEQLYQQARAIVIAQLQAITFNEYLPALLGPDAIPDYEGYDPQVNAGISNIFSTAAYRFGHSMLSTELLRLDNDGTQIDAGNLSLSDAFFNPTAIIEEGIDSLLLGLATQQAQEIDTFVVDDVRNFLFGPPGAGGFDLAALNIQRGRDHGLADYNQVRVDVGLQPVENFADISSDPDVQRALESAYNSVNEIDVWVGGLAEDHLPGSSLGELFTQIIVDQFVRLRDGDAFWYESTFRGNELRQIESTTLADVIERNTDVTGLPSNVFFVPRSVAPEFDFVPAELNRGELTEESDHPRNQSHQPMATNPPDDERTRLRVRNRTSLIDAIFALEEAMTHRKMP